MNIRNIILTAIIMLGLIMVTTPVLQAQTCDGNGTNFIDLNGDGFNDNAPDHDGDGIPNGLDADYVKHAQDGNGYQNGASGENQGQGMLQEKTKTKTQTFERLQAFEGRMFQHRVRAFGDMNGFGTGVCDGTGGGMYGSGICDGTGPHGGQNRGSK